MLYNTISLKDTNDKVQIFNIQPITLESHVTEAINRGRNLCKKYRAEKFNINYCNALCGSGRSYIYSKDGEKLDVEVWDD